MSSWAAPLAEAYGACDELARSHYENFPVASRLLPAAMRPHVAALYAFARVADDIADEGTAPAVQRQIQLGAWQAGLHDVVAGAAAGVVAGAVAGVVAGHVAGDRHGVPTSNAAVGPGPTARERLILIAAGHTIRSLDLPIALFDDLVSAFRQDTMTVRYASWCDVLDYCRRSANPVGRLVLRIAGYRDDALDRSSDALCTALQLTNFWQDFGRDWENGRLYVPREIQDACGASEDDLGRGGRLPPAWARAIEECAALTRRQFADGRLVCDAVRGRLRVELRVTWLGGMRILDRAEGGRYTLFDRRPALGKGDLPWFLWRALWWPRRRPHATDMSPA
ncbi:MAG: squalene/phytoene synthase family protein [Acidobacteriota bacterium]